MFMDSLKEARVAFGIVFCAHLLFLLINFNVPEVYSTPLIQSKPLPLTSYEVVQIGKVVSTPQAYILRLVRFKGKVTALRTLSRGRGLIPPEAHTFTLTDNSAAIEIFYTGAQGKNLGSVNTARKLPRQGDSSKGELLAVMRTRKLVGGIPSNVSW